MASPVLEFSVENSQIPIDLFVSKKHPNLPSGVLGFADAAGNIVYSVKNESSNSKPSSSAQTKRVLLDAAGIPVVSIYSHHGGCWRGFKRDGGDEESLIFRVQRTQNTWKRTEFEIFLVDENGGDSISDFRMAGCPFQKSCTIYRGNDILAQTSLMYKLHQIYVKRSRFRLTIFPGSVDHAIIAALVVVFLDGRN